MNNLNQLLWGFISFCSVQKPSPNLMKIELKKQLFFCTCLYYQFKSGSYSVKLVWQKNIYFRVKVIFLNNIYLKHVLFTAGFDSFPLSRVCGRVDYSSLFIFNIFLCICSCVSVCFVFLPFLRSYISNPILSFCSFSKKNLLIAL